MKKLAESTVIERVLQYNCTLISPYVNAATKITVKCNKCSNEFQRIPMALTRFAITCENCKNIEITKKCHEVATLRGGKFIGVYKNNHTKIEWECKQGHVFAAPYGSVTNPSLNHWCWKCSRPGDEGVEYYKRIAVKKKGLCLTPETFTKALSRADWQCEYGHVWNASYVRIVRSWCPTCVEPRMAKNQRYLYSMIVKRFPDAQYNVKKQLPNPKFELDIYIPSIKKAIEYDGIGWHSLPKHKERDCRKDAEAREVGIDLLRISGQDFCRNRFQTLRKIAQFLGLP